jgi:hypothetical protein
VDLPTLGSPTIPHLKPMAFETRRFDRKIVAMPMGQRRGRGQEAGPDCADQSGNERGFWAISASRSWKIQLPPVGKV